MRVDVVAIGTELLLGQIVDTNSSWIGEQLASVGIDSLYQAKVGDNHDRMVEVISGALEHADAVICCGGLGPTQDDITRQALATLMGVELVLDDDRAERIRSMFGSLGRDMPASNILQAYRPHGAEFLAEQPGTAPGLRCPVTVDGREKLVFAVPGVPWEMKEMVSGSVLPELRRLSGDTSVIASRVLRTWGLSEAAVGEALAARIEELDRTRAATIAFLASGIEGLKVRITAKAQSASAAEELLVAEEANCRAVLGDLVFGVDDDTMESVVLAMLDASGHTLAVAESLTGGLLASRLVDVPGASAVFRGGVVSYASDVKFDVLGVPEGPVISEDCARAMATGVRSLLGASVGLGVTGVAGPDEQEGHPPGTVCMAVDIGGVVTAQTVRLPGRRRQVREFACITLLSILRRELLAMAEGP